MTNLFGHSIPSSVLALLVLEAGASFAAFSLILWLGMPQDATLGAAEIMVAAVACTALTVLAGGATGLYSPRLWLRANRVAAGAVLAGIGFLLLGEVLFPGLAHQPGTTLMPWAQLGCVVAFLAAVVSTRLIFGAAARRGMLRGRVVLVGDEAAAMPDRLPAEVALFLRGGAGLEEALRPERMRALRASVLVLRDAAQLPDGVRARLSAAGIRVMGEEEWLECGSAQVDVARLPTDWLAGLARREEGWAERAARRGFDLAVGLALLLFTLPILLLAALAVRLDSPGPVFYRQERVGKGGQVFTLFKFRSMRTDAEKGGAPVWATKQDPRVTRVGRFLRLTRIDEIPQVFNVLLGHMHFVGPRPERPGFVTELVRQIPHYEARHVVKPGITGWAQVNYPYGASVEDARRKLAYDLYYVKRRSLFLDLLIIVATVRVVLFQEGSR